MHLRLDWQQLLLARPLPLRGKGLFFIGGLYLKKGHFFIAFAHALKR
jgi:hypothetical protein